MHRQEGSSVELLTPSQQLKLETEFTPAQIANFKKAFGVFDVNKDGRISTQEIFEVLHTMGNEVSFERQQKIREAVVLVDVDKSGDLDFPEFIQFMKIMDRHNKQEAVEQGQPFSDDEPSEMKYMCLKLSLDGPRDNTRCWRYPWSAINWLMVLAQTVFAIYVTLIAFVDFDWNLSQKPEGKHSLLDHITVYIRMANVINFGLSILMLTDRRKIEILFDVLESKNIKRTYGNLIRYLLLHSFVLNALASGVFIYNINGIKAEPDVIADILELFVPCAAQIVTLYLLMSPFFYFSWHRPIRTTPHILRAIACDLFVFNFLRVFKTLIQMFVLLLVAPVYLVVSIGLLFAKLFRCKNASADRLNTLVAEWRCY